MTNAELQTILKELPPDLEIIRTVEYDTGFYLWPLKGINVSGSGYKDDDTGKQYIHLIFP